MALSCYCGEKDGRTVTEKLRGGRDGQIIRCDSCGVVRRCDASIEQIRELHERNVQKKQLKEDFNRILDGTTNQQNIDTNRRVNKVNRMINGSESLLDIGTGLGFFLEEISSHVQEAVGTEISTAKRGYVKTHTEHSIFEDTPAVCDEYDDGEFDIITLFHVLEHLPEPDKQLRDIRRLLSDNGRLLIEVPNHDDWLPKVSTEYFNFYYQPVHVFYFTAETMTDLLQRTGLEAEIEYEQRYGLENARHWLEHGEPQNQSPSMVANGNDEMDNAYAAVLNELGISDTLLAVASKI